MKKDDAKKTKKGLQVEKKKEEEQKNTLEEQEFDETITRKISQAIKHRRLQKNMTLEAIAKGICSLSYLSKIENMIISAHSSYLEAICERLDINFEELVKQHKQKDLNEVLQWYLYEYNDKLENLVNVLDNPYYNAYDGLVKIVYYLHKSEFSKVEEEITLINNVKSTLTSLEMNIFTLLVTEYYIKTNQFKKIEEKLPIILSLSKLASSFQSLYYEQLFIVGYHLNVRFLCEYCYNLLRDGRFNHYPFSRLFRLQMMMLEIQSRDKYNWAILDLENLCLDHTLTPLHKDIVYFQALIFLNDNQVLKAYELLSKQDALCGRDFALLIYCAYLGEFLSKEEIIARVREYQFGKYETMHKKFVHYLIFKIDGTPRVELAQLLKYHLLPTNNNSPFPLYSRIYLDELLRLGLRTSYHRMLTKYYPDI